MTGLLGFGQAHMPIDEWLHEIEGKCGSVIDEVVQDLKAEPFGHTSNRERRQLQGRIGRAMQVLDQILKLRRAKPDLLVPTPRSSQEWMAHLLMFGERLAPAADDAEFARLVRECTRSVEAFLEAEAASAIGRLEGRRARGRPRKSDRELTPDALRKRKAREKLRTKGSFVR